MKSRSALSLVLALALIALAAPAAHAGRLADAADCSNHVYEKPFTRWLDPFNYFHAPNGGLERGSSGWRLSGGASVVSGNESFHVHDADDRHSLRIPAGAQAETPAMCVSLTSPTLRFFLKRTTGLLNTLHSLKVDVLYEDASGTARSMPMLVALGGGSWFPSLPMLITANLLPNVGLKQSAVAFRFTPLGSSTWWIDDIYVDPFGRY